VIPEDGLSMIDSRWTIGVRSKFRIFKTKQASH